MNSIRSPGLPSNRLDMRIYLQNFQYHACPMDVQNLIGNKTFLFILWLYQKVVNYQISTRYFTESFLHQNINNEVPLVDFWVSRFWFVLAARANTMIRIPSLKYRTNLMLAPLCIVFSAQKAAIQLVDLAGCGCYYGLGCWSLYTPDVYAIIEYG